VEELIEQVWDDVKATRERHSKRLTRFRADVQAAGFPPDNRRGTIIHPSAAVLRKGWRE